MEMQDAWIHNVQSVALSLSLRISAIMATLSLMASPGTTGHQECSFRQLPQTECLKHLLNRPTRVRYCPHCLGGQCLLEGLRDRTADEHIRVELCDAFGARDKPRFLDADFATPNHSAPLYIHQKKAPGYVQEG